MNEHAHTPRSSAMPEEVCGMPNGEGRCITCSDEALKVHVIAVDVGAGTARVVVTPDRIEEVDISLLEQVGPGDRVLVHAGVALERCSAADDGVEEGYHA